MAVAAVDPFTVSRPLVNPEGYANMDKDTFAVAQALSRQIPDPRSS